MSGFKERKLGRTAPLAQREHEVRGVSLKPLACALWVALALLLTQFLTAFPLRYLSDYLSRAGLQTLYAALSYTLAAALIVFGGQKLVKSWKTSRTELGLTGLPTWTDLGLAPVAFIVYLFLAAALTSAMSSFFPWFDASQAQDVGYNYLSTGLDKVLAFTSLCLIAPFFEELIFRGWLYGKLRALIKFQKPASHPKLRLFLSALVPTFLTSFLFGLLHLQWNVGINVFAMSLILCLLREITGTIYSGILLHVIKNTIAFVILYILGIQ